jgi:hypothetical protein
MNNVWFAVPLMFLFLTGCGNGNSHGGGSSDKANGAATSCHLKVPVALPGDPMAEERPVFKFKNVRVSQIPKQYAQDHVNGKLDLHLFQINYGRDWGNSTPTGYLGAGVSYNGSLGFGFAQVYAGGYSFSGGMSRKNEQVTYFTQESSRRVPRTIQVSVVNGMITSIELKEPISGTQSISVCVEEMTFDRTL